MAQVNTDYLSFHTSLLGYDCYLDGKWIPKFQLFWAMQRSKNTAKRLASVVVKKKKE